MANYYGQYRIESNRMPGWDYSRNGYYFVTPVIKNMRRILGKVKDGEMILSDFGKIVNEEWYNSFEIRKELFLDEFIIMPNHLHAIIIIKHPENAQEKLPEFQTSTNFHDLSSIDNFDENEYFDNQLNEFPNRNGNFDEIKNSSGIGNGNLPGIGNGNSPGIGNGNSPGIGNGNSPGIGNGNSPAIGNGNSPGIGNGNSPGIGKVQTHGRASLHSPHSPHSIPHRPPHSISSFMAGFKSATTTLIDDFIDLHHLQIPKYNKNNRLWQLNYNDRIIRNDVAYWQIKNYIKNNPVKWEKDKFHS